MLSRLLLIVGGLLCGLVVGEVALRMLAPETAPLRDVQTAYPMVFPAPGTGAAFGFRPNARFTGTYDGDPYGTLPGGARVVYELNDFGFRDDPLAPRLERSGGVFAAILGDSFTFGEGVEVADLFSNVCRRRLPESETYAIVNLGVSGYATRDELAVARTLVPRLRPHWVVVAYCLNDPIGLDDRRYEGRRGFDLIVRRDEHLRGRPSEHPLHLVRLLADTARERRIAAETVTWYRDLYRGPGAPWVSARQDLVEIRDVAGRAGARTAVALLPIFHGLDGDYPFEAEHRLVSEWCADNGIPVLDLQPLFAGMDARDLVVHPKDHHPNARAHALIGAALADFLLELERTE